MSEGFTTVLALERFFSRVCPDVGFQGASLRKTPGTVFTFEGSLACRKSQETIRTVNSISEKIVDGSPCTVQLQSRAKLNVVRRENKGSNKSLIPNSLR